MTFLADVAFCLRPRCPACRKSRLFKPWSVSVVDECARCHIKLGRHDVGDGAAVFLTFLLGFTIIPAAWAFERAVAPPLWVHGVLWTIVALAAIALLLPASKAYIISLEYRHRPGEWKK